MLIEQRILRMVYRHLNCGLHPITVLLPEPDYDKLLREFEPYYWIAPELREVKPGEQLFLQCAHDRLLVLRRPGGKVYWQWEFKANG